MGEDIGASRNFIEDNALTKSFLEPLPAGACRFAEKLPDLRKSCPNLLKDFRMPVYLMTRQTGAQIPQATALKVCADEYICQPRLRSFTLVALEIRGAIPMTVIRQEDFIASVAGALQYISYYHPGDYITSLAKAYEREQSPAAKDAMAQILINSRMCAEGHRPICQDTGIVNAFVKVGMDVRFEAAPGEERKDLQQMVDEGVRRAYLDPDNKLRASILADPAGKRKNTKDNTPACVTVELVKGATVDVTVAAKGGGSGATAKLIAALQPGSSPAQPGRRAQPEPGVKALEEPTHRPRPESDESAAPDPAAGTSAGSDVM